ncbi:hypothetical protein FAZ19_18915 [Sphingobacterium alkalisoli]|uniref:Uncharacterized protein n=1 Tax=Sphingobacterium alkalisoli TaxID=1874115 RepID=A0A4U0GUA8_9SPHI|nr:hypothetical protein [Sphingobacterium alkalisoli]TJY62547.1 hypothetical protein FAZ19_18915 [Sphingobacterium alkalisoli]GGH27368.1 hypothetical protein GCM10011418_37260 [Sphingobacterium alkalisoli]
MTNSFIAIKGNHFDRAGEIFSVFKYIDLKQDKQFDDWQTFNEYLFDNYFEFANNEVVIRGIWTDNGWTIIHDPEMVDTVEEEALLQLSRILDTDIVTFIIQTTSNSFGFTVYNDTIKRHFFVSDGEITDNLYQPLEQENGLNINENIFSDDILKLAEKLGIDLEAKIKRTYSIKQLAYGDEMKSELEHFRQQQNQANTDKKPWWKLW